MRAVRARTRKSLRCRDEYAASLVLSTVRPQTIVPKAERQRGIRNIGCFETNRRSLDSAREAGSARDDKSRRFATAHLKVRPFNSTQFDFSAPCSVVRRTRRSSICNRAGAAVLSLGRVTGVTAAGLAITNNRSMFSRAFLPRRNAVLWSAIFSPRLMHG